MIQCHGYKNGKYQIFETDPAIRLDFQGPDKERFEQINPPEDNGQYAEIVELVLFNLTVDYLMTEFPGFLPTIN